MTIYPVIRLKPGKEKSLERKHPWIFSGALMDEVRNFEEGSILRVCDVNGLYLATGYVQYGSIAVRILSFEDETIDTAFWEKRISNSFRLRNALGILKKGYTNACRLMHGEGDGIPGLIIDYYAGTAVIQCHSSGLYALIEDIAEALKKVLGPELKAVYNKSSETLHGSVPGAENAYLFGDGGEETVYENGLKFFVDWKLGQKTGFFLDQRDNRALLGHYAAGKTVLNTFAYTGGFSVYALARHAQKVVSVDVSKNAIELLNRNMELNLPGAANHEAYAEDTFQFFKRSNETFDIVILDPPAFAKNMGAKHNAIKGYKRLNAEGFKQVKSGGLMFTFSCSQVIDNHTFQQTVYSAAIDSGRSVRILHRLTQPADHPVNLFHPEGEYLKGLVLYVE